MSVIEHTLNILIFPGLHSDFRGSETSHGDLVDATSSVSIATSIAVNPHIPQPCLNVPGLKKLGLPSPLHLKLHVLTRLSFNEQGRITRHRDFWDVRDVIGLVPGMTIAQWIGTRLTAHGLSLASRAASWVFSRSKTLENDLGRSPPSGASSATIHGENANTSANDTPNALGLELNLSEGERSRHGIRWPISLSSLGQAPDVDRDSGS